ncbi:MAG TPA: DNA-3-methyladenine glycosylase I [Candidatus Baltobacteraceae bacterium]|jgi:DNA-3-methyladenine glycosylase I
MKRCVWAVSELAIAYHDREWGVAIHDDSCLFEFLVLEGAQAGLSWETILRKRERYRERFEGFDPHRVARFTPKKIEQLMRDPGIVRNRLKILSAVRNAKAFIDVQSEAGSFDAYLWGFVNGKPICNRPKSIADVPATTALSDAISKDLRRRGFSFVGSTIVYAYMQAVGLVSDHVAGCWRAC